MSETNAGITTADLYDELEDALDSCSTQFRRFGRKARFHGAIVTVRCFRDNQIVKETLNSPGEGKVLVVDGDANVESALMGDMIAEAAVKNGWAGVVINGAIRDSVAVDELDLGVKALGTNPRKSAKAGEGEKDVPVSFGGATFTPGDHLWSDEDGVVVTSAENAKRLSTVA